MKALLFCSEQGNQKALANKIMAVMPLAGIVVVRPSGGARRPTNRLKQAAVRGLRLVVGLPLRRAWFGMLSRYDRLYPRFPDVPLLHAGNVNASEVVALVERERPDLVIVSGTNLLKAPLIRAILATGRVMNLHTGISPYVKGAPNCTNWCLAIGRFDLIGNTIMWLDAGIDSGNLIATERTPLDGSESLGELHIKVMEHGHDLYLRCIARFARGERLPDVPQSSIGPGSLFLTRDWTPRRIAQAVWNFRARYAREAGRPPREPLTLVSPQPLRAPPRPLAPAPGSD